jgi:DNA (cytosine-5)-methyltransferase 1
MPLQLQWQNSGDNGGGYIQLEINKPIRLIELFSGIGFQRMALRDVGAEFESWRTCEWDVNAIRQYKAIHCSDNNQDYSHGKTKEQLVDILLQAGISSDGKKPMTRDQLAGKSEKWLREVYNDCCATLNLVDISKVTGENLQIEDVNNYCYILTYSFPCQSLSIAGLQGGMEESSGTSSSLLWEVKRVLSGCTELPQILLMENVKQVHSPKNLPQFEEWMKFLESLGYSNFWQDMNAKDYGVPQSRKRTFMVSILDTTNQITFEFPKPIKLNKEFADVLVDENVVEERFYIDSPKARELVQKFVDGGELGTDRFNRHQSEAEDYRKSHSCYGTRYRETSAKVQWCRDNRAKGEIHFVGNITPTKKRENPNAGRVYMINGIAPTLTAMEGGGRQPHIIVRSVI